MRQLNYQMRDVVGNSGPRTLASAAAPASTSTPGRGHYRRHLPATQRRPRSARPHARLAGQRGHLRHYCGTPASHPAAKWTQRTQPGHLSRHRHHPWQRPGHRHDRRLQTRPLRPCLHVGGLLAWSGQPREQIASQLIDAGIAAGLGTGLPTRIVRRALANGEARPLTPLGRRQQAV
jgi:hypothetical protein